MRSILSLFLFFSLALVNGQDTITNIIRAGSLFDSESGTVLSKQLIIVKGNTIVAVEEDKGSYPSDANIIDLSDKFVMPGMMDVHTHLLLHPYNEANWNDQVLKESIPERTLRAANHAKATLLAGFTTIRDLGSEGAGYADKEIKDAIEKNIIPGPRTQIASKALVITGAYGPKGYNDEVHFPLGAAEADGVEGVRKEVRNQIGHGADWIKLYGDYRRKDGKNFPLFTLEEIKTAVEEAAAVKLSVAVHAVTPKAIELAVKGGAKSIEHGTMATEESFKLMKEKGVAWVPTLSAIHSILAYAGKEKYQSLLEKQKETFALGLKSGVNIVCGSDAGVFTHGTNALELELMVKYGMNEKHALQSATIGAAKLLKIDTQLGSITKSKLADIIAINGNPFENIEDLRKVVFVMKDGVVYMQ